MQPMVQVALMPLASFIDQMLQAIDGGSKIFGQLCPPLLECGL